MTDLLNIAKECGAELVEPFRGVISKREMLTMTTDQLQATVEKVCGPLVEALEKLHDCSNTVALSHETTKDQFNDFNSALNTAYDVVYLYKKLMGQDK